MKIDESCINHNAIRLIDEEVSALFEFVGEDDDLLRVATLGEIRGVCILASALKEVLSS